MKYRAEIDGLRAVAVLPVILFHAGFPLFRGGFVGVDVFFVISGFLITTILVDEIAQGRFSIAGFYERRARRILPALFAVMALCLPFAWAWLMPGPFRDFFHAASPPSACSPPTWNSGRRAAISRQPAKPSRSSTPGAWRWKSSTTSSSRYFWPRSGGSAAPG
ncbi:acyltransferase family protein [Novosphingobium colocasiae]